MTEAVFAKVDIACEYLDAAMQFYIDGRNYFCAIHLAGAAEELLGAHLPESERIFTRAWKGEKALQRIETGNTPSDKEAIKEVNEWKNEVKHTSDGASRTLCIDPAFAAAHHIEEALRNFYKLDLPKSPTLWRFEDHQNQRMGRL